MPRPPPPAAPIPRAAVPPAEIAASLVPAGGRFCGLVAFRGRARLDGQLEGDVRAEGTLLLGPTAHLTGCVDVDELIVAGTLDGEVRARARIELEATASVRGTLETPLLEMAEGSILEGRCSAGTPARARPPERRCTSPTA